MLGQNQSRCPRSFRICYPGCPLDKEEEEGQVLDSVNLHFFPDNTRPTTSIGIVYKRLSKSFKLRLTGRMFPCLAWVRWRVSSKLRAHTYVGIHFFSLRDIERTAALYGGHPQWMRRAFAPFRAFERRCLRSSLACGLIAGQSPTELGMSSSSSANINVPVLDSRIKQTRIVTKSCWLTRGQAAC